MEWDRRKQATSDTIVCMEELISVQAVHKALNRLMSHHESEIRRWKDTLTAHADEGDYAVNAELSIKVALEQAAWNAVFDVAKVLRIGLGDKTEEETQEGGTSAH